MVHYEKAYIRHYKRNDNKNNRVIKSVEVRGIKNNTKFKDKQEIIIISNNDFNQLNNEIKELKETNNNLMQELTNKDHTTNHDNILLYNKLLELMEIINNRNELLLNANDSLNIMIDAIINDMENEYNNIINANNKEIKQRLETFIKSIVNNANDSQKQQNNLIASEINIIENELKEANKQLNNMSILDFIRKRKQININLDLSKLKEMPTEAINYNDLNFNIASDNILIWPDVKKLDHKKIKENSKKAINFNDLYIKLDSEKD